MTVTALAPWFGSNRTLAPAVGEELRMCDWVGIMFAGGMSEVPHIDARTVLVNDKHWHMMNLASVVADAQLGPQLYRKLRRLPFHPLELKAAQTTCERFEIEQLDELLNFEAAFNYFVAVWMGRSASAGTDKEFTGNLAVRWDAGGGDSAVRFQSAVRSSCLNFRRALARCTFSTRDAFDFLEDAKDLPGHGIYNDPPFPGAGEKYKWKFSVLDHRKLARQLSEFTNARVVCRFYDHPLIRELYPADAWTWRHLQGGRKQSNAPGPEVLIINGPSYADREEAGKP